MEQSTRELQGVLIPACILIGVMIYTGEFICEFTEHFSINWYIQSLGTLLYV